MYIHKDKVISHLYTLVDYYYERDDKNMSKAFYDCAEAINDGIPDADVREERYGHWIDLDAYDIHHVPIYMCSDCFKEVADIYIKNHKYCLHCGAKMKRGEM